jgi:4-alpha-glucanotransferase
MGDIPIYIAPGSADHVEHPELFQAGEVAGAPPDKFTDAGQLWGNPLYDWARLRRTGFAWWTERFRRTFELFDLTRIDHFRGFVAYWSVPEDAEDARSGRWRRGPGREPFDAAAAALGSLPLVAEDLGVITPPVERLRDDLGLPGMVVLQFGYDPDDPTSPHRVGRHPENRITYTGTHDHDTIRGWWESAGDEVRDAVEEDLGERDIAGDDVAASLVRLNASSRARVAVVQAQDVVGLGSEARMNVPGSMGASWRWKLEEGQLGDAEARRLRAATEESGRLP